MAGLKNPLTPTGTPAKPLSKPVRNHANHAETSMTIVNEIVLKLRRQERDTSTQYRRRRYVENAGIGADKLQHKLTRRGAKIRGTSARRGVGSAGGESRGHVLENNSTRNPRQTLVQKLLGKVVHESSKRITPTMTGRRNVRKHEQPHARHASQSLS